MTFTALGLALVGLALAFVNGANDVSKGVATLVGSGVTHYRRAIAWGTVWTAAGGLLGAILATAMVTTFGKGLLTAGTVQTFDAGVATLVGAAAWVLIATRTGLPVSTTHAIVGSLVGVALAAYGVDGVQWSALGGKVVLPLLLSPVLSLALVVGLLKVTRPAARAAPAPDCVCAEMTRSEPAPAGMTGLAFSGPASLEFVVGTERSCTEARPRAARLTLNHLHWLSAGTASFARGLNDAPKIVALVAAAGALHGVQGLPQPALFGLVTGAMVVGSLVGGRRVTAVLAEKVTPMDHREGFLANLVTAVLVTVGATQGLPMSTTHVSSGGIIGAGASRSSLNLETTRGLVLAWVVTLPASAALGIAALLMMRWPAAGFPS